MRPKSQAESANSVKRVKTRVIESRDWLRGWHEFKGTNQCLVE